MISLITCLTLALMTGTLLRTVWQTGLLTGGPASEAAAQDRLTSLTLAVAGGVLLLLGLAIGYGDPILRLVGVGYAVLWTASLAAFHWGTASRLSPAQRLFVLTGLTLQGIGASLVHPLSPDPAGRIWLHVAAQILLTYDAMLAAAVLLLTRAPQALAAFGARLSTGWGVIATLLLVAASLPAGFIPYVRFQTWPLCLLSLLLGGSAVASRLATGAAMPVTAGHWLAIWRPALIISTLPALCLIIPCGHPPDFAPAAIACVVFFVLLHCAGQGRASVLLGCLAFLLAIGAYTIHASDRVTNRILAWRAPAYAETSQQIEGCWYVASGYLLGQGCGQGVTATGRPLTSLRAGTRRSSTPPLGATDGIGASAFGTFGAIGGSLLLLWIAVPALLLWQWAYRADAIFTRLWLAGTGTIYSLLAILGLAWPLDWAPVSGVQIALLGGGRISGIFWALLWAAALLVPQLSLDTPSSLPQVHARNGLRGVRAAAIVFLLLGVGLISGLWYRAVFVRYATLRTPYYGATDESHCREAVLRGWVIACNGRPMVNPDPRVYIKRRERVRLQHAIDSGHLICRQNDVIVISGSWRRYAPGSLGRIWARAPQQGGQ
jgi:cell division protein FtsW (lipid II flippase)